MEPDTTKNLLEALKVTPHTLPAPLPAEATDEQKQAHALHTDACMHVKNAIDCLKRSIASR